MGSVYREGTAATRLRMLWASGSAWMAWAWYWKYIWTGKVTHRFCSVSKSLRTASVVCDDPPDIRAVARRA
jgi:hypothetical protein